MEVVIGQKIKEVIEEKGMKINDFARRINTVRQNVYKIFTKQKIDTGLLIKISEVLDYDFFQFIQPKLSQIESNSQHLGLHKVYTETEYQNLKAQTLAYEKDLDLAKREINYLKKIIDLMEDKVRLVMASLPEEKAEELLKIKENGN